jgi:SecD/SecF fusion protein
MLRRHLWKLTLSAALVLWSVFTLMPLKDQPFGDFVKQKATAKPAEFTKLLGEVATRIQAGRAPSVYVALKQIGAEQKLDLSQFFPDIKLESTLTNVEKRNNILLNELLRRSKSPLQLGLDLKGGVAYTLEIDAGTTNAANPAGRPGKAQQSDRDHRQSHQRPRRHRADHPRRGRQPHRGPAPGCIHQG